MSTPEARRIGPTDIFGHRSRSLLIRGIATREQTASALETHMSIHTRKLPTNSTTLLDRLVDPNSQLVEAPSPATAPAPVHRETVVAPDDPSPPHSFAEPKAPSDGAANLPWYRRETWLAVQIVAIIPIVGAILVPAAYRLPLCVLGGALVAIGTVMMLRHKPASAAGSFETR